MVFKSKMVKLWEKRKLPLHLTLLFYFIVTSYVPYFIIIPLPSFAPTPPRDFQFDTFSSLPGPKSRICHWLFPLHKIFNQFLFPPILPSQTRSYLSFPFHCNCSAQLLQQPPKESPWFWPFPLLGNDKIPLS